MIKTIRIDIPFSETQSMDEVFENKLAEFGLKISDIELKGVISRDSYSVTSHYGNWCYVSARDIPELHNTDLKLDMPQYILEQNDVKNLKVGDKVNYTFANSLMWESSQTGKIVEIKSDSQMTMITITKGKSRSKGYRFYTGDCVVIEKI